MDNFTHSLAGWTLGQTGLKRKSRKGLAALILGANAPDIDVFFGWVPWVPLATHRGVTHGLLSGFVVLPIALAGLLWLFDRWQVKRGDTFKSGLEMRFGWLVVLSYLGCLTHPLLDWQTTYAVQLLSPFSDLWFHNDSLFIIDVWVLAGMAGAIWLSRRREKRGEGNWRRPAVVAALGVVAYICANGALSQHARQLIAVSDRPDQRVVVAASPPPVLFWTRDVVWRQDGAVSSGWFNPLASFGSLKDLSAPAADGMDDPLVQRELANNPVLVTFGRWSIMPTAKIKRGRCATRIAYNDARFAMNPVRGPHSEVITVPTGAEGCPR